MRYSVTLSLAAAASLTACQSLDTRPNQGPCPAAGSVYDAARLVRFADEAERFSNITFTGEIVDVRTFCRYVEDDPIVAQVEIDFAFGRGPAGTENRQTYEYFVAVTRTNRAVMDKEVFTVEADFGRDGQLDGKTELINRITIPRADETISGANFEILVGFELTEEQLEFNRAGKRFRLDANQ